MSFANAYIWLPFIGIDLVSELYFLSLLIEMPCLFHVVYADSLVFHCPWNIPCHPLGVFLLTTSCCCLQLTAVMIRLVVPKFRSQRI